MHLVIIPDGCFRRAARRPARRPAIGFPGSEFEACCLRRCCFGWSGAGDEDDDRQHEQQVDEPSTDAADDPGSYSTRRITRIVQSMVVSGSAVSPQVLERMHPS
jgi:hypothetical protein